MPTDTEQVIGDIERASSLSQLAAILQKVAEDFGYSAFSFVDAPRLGLGNPTVINTIRSAFDADYRAEGLLAVDPMIPVVRRTNTPFTWGSVKLPPRLGRRLPGRTRPCTSPTITDIGKDSSCRCITWIGWAGPIRAW